LSEALAQQDVVLGDQHAKRSVLSDRMGRGGAHDAIMDLIRAPRQARRPDERRPCPLVSARDTIPQRSRADDYARLMAREPSSLSPDDFDALAGAAFRRCLEGEAIAARPLGE